MIQRIVVPVVRAALMVAMVISFAAQSANAAQPPVYQTQEGAIDGYDTVAYFVAGAPAKGDKAYTHAWNGANWYFASATNRDLFKAEPEKYAPRYGGY